MIVSRVALDDIHVGAALMICKPGHCRLYVPSGWFRRLMEWLRIVDKRRLWGVAETAGRKGDIITMRITM